jgi:predicted DNA-binding protein (MmcQ/YjbR family)
MITEEQFRTIVTEFPEVTEALHSGNTSFQVKKKIFAVINPLEGRATIKLNESDQYAFCTFDKSVIFPVPNKWGKHGWTHLNLKKISLEILHDALATAYCTVAPKKLAQLVILKNNETDF